MLLHFHGEFQDGVLGPFIKIIEKQIYTFFKVSFSIFILNVAIIVLLILIHQINDFCSVCLNVFVIHLHMATISKPMSNSRSITKNSVKG